MGCDGGTIPRRDELVKVKRKPEAKDKIAELNFQWQHCTITQEKLEEPIVACGMGRLYTKSSLIEALLSRSLPECSKHIKTLKDVKDLKLTPNREHNSSAEKREGMLDGRAVPYMCQITKMEMTGMHKFVFLWTCGCVFSERALKEIKLNNCHICQTPFTVKDVVILNGSKDDMELMKINMEERMPIKKKKKKIKEELDESFASTSSALSSSSGTASTSSSGVGSSDNLATKIETETCPPNKANDKKIPAIKIESDRAAQQIKREHTENDLLDPDIKKIKTNYSVALDPAVTDVYKSIFTSHKSEREQTRAHWITYNPFYN